MHISVQETWRSLGFVFTTEADLTAYGILHSDLIHMDNTVQMHKTVPPARQWSSVIFRCISAALLNLGFMG